MLDKPDLPDETLRTCLNRAFTPHFTRVEFLPIGADNHTAVYRARDELGGSYFVRLRSGGFDPLNVTLLHYLKEQGLGPVIAPIPARDGSLWAGLDPYTVMLYPFIEGQNLYQTGLPEQQWLEFGRSMKRLHSLKLPLDLAMRIRRERFADSYRQSLRLSLNRVIAESFDEPIARQCATLLRQRYAEIQDLIKRVEQLAEILISRNFEEVLCHADLHAGNLLVEPSGIFHIIDWDEVLLAPKERDLMYVGGGLLGNWRSPAEEEAFFYQGYGPVDLNPAAITYYRYERILTDLAIYADELLAVQGSREERELSFRYMASNFFPGGVLEIARATDQA